MKKTAIVLFNLGGPDHPQAVQPFLFNLFRDPAIIRVPQPLRYLIAKLISTRRAPVARAIYAQMGGGSPILPNTQAQAQALEKELNTDSDQQFKTFIAMRYWHPFGDQTVAEVQAFAPDDIILLPLYPQFSTTTTGSSLEDWQKNAAKKDLKKPTKIICCYPRQQGFIDALAQSVRTAYDQAAAFGTPRVLFSAHGLPEKIVKDGDPYQKQCEQTVDALRAALNIPALDSVLCFQSRVGPMKWITPSTDEEIRRAGRDKVPVVIAPVAFVSDHSETLVEIDIEYRHLAKEQGVPFFASVPTVGTATAFIAGLASMVRAACVQTVPCTPCAGQELCDNTSTCPCRGK